MPSDWNPNRCATPDCGAAIATSRRYCQVCSDRRKASGRARYSVRKALRLCYQCGTHLTPEEGAYCDACMTKRRPQCRAYARVRRDKGFAAAGPNQIGCCGTMHAITQLPMRLSCGHVVALRTEGSNGERAPVE
jgi:hypothetical protein